MGTDNTPTIDQFRPIVLRVLNHGEELPVRSVVAAVVEHMKLSDDVLAERLPSGQARYKNRINWACSALTQAGLLNRPKRAHYRITDNGLAVDARNLSTYSEKDMLEWPEWVAYQDEIAARKQASPEVDSDTSETEPSDPIQAMVAAEQAFNAQTETDLRKRLQESSPEFFEKAVIDVLWAMGYGGAHGAKKHVGRTGDGGIDGVIRQDALGLTNIYIQAKRYADTNKVGEPEIRNFIGSLDARGANLGVFITTSSFQPRAEETASRYRHGRIVLIDGLELTSLMLTYGVAVHKSKQFTLYSIDDDFFDEDLA